MDVFYEKIMQEFKDTDMPDDVYERSIAYGTQVADHIVAWSGKDNYKQSRSFPKYSILDDPAPGNLRRRHTWMPLNHIGTKSEPLASILQHNLNLRHLRIFYRERKSILQGSNGSL